MKTLKAIIFLSFYLLFTSLVAADKSKIINKLNSIDNIQFNFIQKTNEKLERGKCILVFPNKLKCDYEDKNKKELIINKKMMAITQKRYGKTLFIHYQSQIFLTFLVKTN